MYIDLGVPLYVYIGLPIHVYRGTACIGALLFMYVAAPVFRYPYI